MAKQKQDKYVNRMIKRCVMDGANTLTFEQIQIGVGLFEGKALLIHRALYEIDETSIGALETESDLIDYGLTVSDNLSDFKMTHGEIIDRGRLCINITGTAATNNVFEMPIVHDFSTLPGGGLIVPANPLFLTMSSAGLAAAGTLDCEIYFTFLELGDADYLELLQSQQRANL